MATPIPFRSDIDLGLNQLIKALFEQLSVEPAITEGRVYYNTVTKLIGFCNATAWVYIDAGTIASNLAAHIAKGADNTDAVHGATATPAASKIAKFDANTKLSSGAAPTASTNEVLRANDLVSSITGEGSATKVVHEAGLKTIIDTVMSAITSGTAYQGDFDGSKTIAANSITTIKAGFFWRVSVAGTASGINTPSGTGLHVGDVVYARVTKTSAIAASDFDGFDNTEATDILRDGNVISNILTTSSSGIPNAAAIISAVGNATTGALMVVEATITAATSGTITSAALIAAGMSDVRYAELQEQTTTASGIWRKVFAPITIESGVGVAWATNSAFTGKIVISGDKTTWVGETA